MVRDDDDEVSSHPSIQDITDQDDSDEVINQPSVQDITELDPDDSNGLMDNPRIQEITEFSESEMEETEQMLFQPPPMFARYCLVLEAPQEGSSILPS